MNRILSLTAFLLSLTLPSWTAEPSPTAKQAVLKAEDEWKTAVLKADRNTLEKLLAPDLSYTHSSAKTQTKEQFIEDVMSGSTVYKSIEFSNTNLRQYGNTVVITHPAVITSVPTGVSHLYLLEVWAQQGHSWQLVSRLATKLP